MMKEFDPYITCVWCGKEVHQVDYSTHECPNRDKYILKILDLKEPPKRNKNLKNKENLLD